MKNSKTKAFLEKIRFKYKVSILNENTLEEVFHIKLSRLYVFLGFCTILSICFIFNSILIIKTPIRQFLPGYEESGVRAEFIHNSIIVDSLANVVDKQNDYIQVLRYILSGDIKVDNINQLDSLSTKSREKLLLEKPEKEKDFCEQFEKEEQYNISTQTPIANTTGAYIFYPPTKGMLSKKYNPQKGHYGVDIITSPNASVMAVLDGTVIFSTFSINDGYTIGIQHENGYISIYKNNSQILKSESNYVSAGEPIAITGNTGDKNASKNHLHFELWQNGKSLNPEEFIIF